MVIDERCAGLWRSVEVMWPFVAEHAVDIQKTGRLELTIDLDNGDRYVYEGLGNKMSRVRNKDQLGEMTECEWRNEFASRLNRKMEQAFIDQTELSERTGISKVTLSSYMNGRSTPSVYNLRKIANALNCPFGYLSCEE